MVNARFEVGRVDREAKRGGEKRKSNSKSMDHAGHKAVENVDEGMEFPKKKVERRERGCDSR